MHSPFLDKLNHEEKTALNKRLFEIQSGKCFICGKEMDLDIGELDIDHIIPISEKGAKDNESNFALTHKSCNCSKGASNLFVGRAIYKIKNLREEFKKNYIKNPQAYSATHSGANLGDLLESVGGSKYKLRYKIENSTFVYSLPEMGNEIFRIPVFTDKLSGAKSVFLELPIEYCYHDDKLNPRSINSSFSELIKEFYAKRPQLQVSLARINNEEKKVLIFDGQHKSAAQIALGANKLLLRLFVDYDENELRITNQRAGKELKQIEFNKNILTQLNSRAYQDYVEKYQKDHNLSEEEYKFSEQDLIRHFGKSTKIKLSIIESQKNRITKNNENKLLQFIDFEGRGKDLPLSYDAYSSAFLALFIDTKDFTKELLEDDDNERNIEFYQLNRLQNIIAEKMYIGKFDSEQTVDKVENKIATGKGNDISDNHLACLRYSRKSILKNWLSVLNEFIFSSLYYTRGEKPKEKNYFKIRFSDVLWQNIEKYIDLVVNLPLWKDRTKSETLFAANQTDGFWKAVFNTGKTPDGSVVLASPINIKTIENLS